MKKKLTAAGLLGVVLFYAACSSGNSAQVQVLEQRIADLEKNSYKPGFGEFMSAVQVHHAKLWYAGQNQNWRLADFEVHEIKESLDDLRTYVHDRPETQQLDMISPAIDSVQNAIRLENTAEFKKAYLLLTNTCNSCHRATQHGFNIIKIPDTPPFTNQDFKAIEK